MSGDEFGFDVVFEGAQEMRNGVVLGVDCVAVFFGLWLVVEWECLDDCAQVAELWSWGGVSSCPPTFTPYITNINHHYTPQPLHPPLLFTSMTSKHTPFPSYSSLSSPPYSDAHNF